uniref:ATP synthase CF0 B subunit n=1 Tax=Juncus effusus TaxID=13579 RepID=A0A8A3SRR0_JUNEF|nr:ATP synthase CF0 B subunit [Juncus effusus]QSZ78348.1 ATP synthase CF0 B subunit [Juncus effusus]
MKNLTDSFVFLGHWSFAGSFGLNTDILATNLINLIVVISVLVLFGKGVYFIIENRGSWVLFKIRKNYVEGPSSNSKKLGFAYRKWNWKQMSIEFMDTLIFNEINKIFLKRLMRSWNNLNKIKMKSFIWNKKGQFIRSGNEFSNKPYKELFELSTTVFILSYIFVRSVLILAFSVQFNGR